MNNNRGISLVSVSSNLKCVAHCRLVCVCSETKGCTVTIFSSNALQLYNKGVATQWLKINDQLSYPLILSDNQTVKNSPTVKEWCSLVPSEQEACVWNEITCPVKKIHKPNDKNLNLSNWFLIQQRTRYYQHINLQTHKIRRTDWKKSAPFPDRRSMALIPTIASTNPDLFFFFVQKPSTSATNSSSRLRNWVTRTIFMSTAKIAHRNKWSSSKWCWRRRLRRQLQ